MTSSSTNITPCWVHAARTWWRKSRVRLRLKGTDSTTAARLAPSCSMRASSAASSGSSNRGMRREYSATAEGTPGVSYMK